MTIKTVTTKKISTGRYAVLVNGLPTGSDLVKRLRGYECILDNGITITAPTLASVPDLILKALSYDPLEYSRNFKAKKRKIN